MTKYVLVSQGIKIYETFNKEEAKMIMSDENNSWRRCFDSNYQHVDNEIFMYEEEVPNMTNESFQKWLAEMYSMYSATRNSQQKTLNQLVYILRKSSINYQLTITRDDVPNGCVCIPGVIDTFIPVKDLAAKVVSVEFDEETYEDCGIELLLVKVQ